MKCIIRDDAMTQKNPGKNASLLIGLLLLLALVVACAQAPVTGRSQLILVGPRQEIALGMQAYREILRKEKLSRNPRLNKLLQDVGWRIARAANRPDYKWEFHLIDNDKVANAFCLPGGKVFVYTGILKYTRDANGLATVIGHEVAHALARHGAERMSLALVARVGEAALEAALSSGSPQATRAFRSAYGLASNVGLLLPYSRTQEFEADYIGLVLMARACFDPRGAVAFWNRMIGHDKGKGVPVFLSTHPADTDRLNRIKRLLPRTLEIYTRRCTSSAREKGFVGS